MFLVNNQKKIERSLSLSFIHFQKSDNYQKYRKKKHYFIKASAIALQLSTKITKITFRMLRTHYINSTY